MAPEGRNPVLIGTRSCPDSVGHVFPPQMQRRITDADQLITGLPPSCQTAEGDQRGGRLVAEYAGPAGPRSIAEGEGIARWSPPTDGIKEEVMGRPVLVLLLSVACVFSTAVAGEGTDVDRAQRLLDRNAATNLPRTFVASDGAMFQVLQDSAAGFEIVRSSREGQSRRLLIQRLASDLLQHTWLVRFESESGETVVAHVIVSTGHVSASGTADGTTFHYSAAFRENDAMFLSRSFGDLHVAAKFNLANLDDPRNELAANQLREYQTALTKHPAWDTVVSGMSNTVSDMLETSSHFDFVGRVVALAIGSVGSSAGTRSIESYMKCLRNACEFDGGCWSGTGCHGCAGDPTSTQLFAFMLYQIDAEICFLREIVNPIQW